MGESRKAVVPPPISRPIGPADVIGAGDVQQAGRNRGRSRQGGGNVTNETEARDIDQVRPECLGKRSVGQRPALGRGNYRGEVFQRDIARADLNAAEVGIAAVEDELFAEDVVETADHVAVREGVGMLAR